ncbi:MAG: hypothetical protein AABZ74_06995 [Cyanobacteriota bacterium]
MVAFLKQNFSVNILKDSVPMCIVEVITSNQGFHNIYVNDICINKRLKDNDDKSIFLEFLNNNGTIRDSLFETYGKKTGNRRSETIRRIDKLLCDICSIDNDRYFIKRGKNLYTIEIEYINELDMFIGNYYMYYLGTSEKGVIRRVVARIFKQDNSTYIEFKSTTNTYRGIIESKTNCLFSSMEQVKYNKYKVFTILYGDVGTAFDTITGLMSFADNGIPTSTKILLIKTRQNLDIMKPNNFDSYNYINDLENHLEDDLLDIIEDNSTDIRARKIEGLQKKLLELLSNDIENKLVCDKKPEHSKFKEKVLPLYRVNKE